MSIQNDTNAYKLLHLRFLDIKAVENVPKKLQLTICNNKHIIMPKIKIKAVIIYE